LKYQKFHTFILPLKWQHFEASLFPHATSLFCDLLNIFFFETRIVFSFTPTLFCDFDSPQILPLLLVDTRFLSIANPIPLSPKSRENVLRQESAQAVMSDTKQK